VELYSLPQSHTEHMVAPVDVVYEPEVQFIQTPLSGE